MYADGGLHGTGMNTKGVKLWDFMFRFDKRVINYGT